MPPKLKGIDGLHMRFDALIKSYSSWVDGAAANAFTGRNASVITARNERDAAESYRRLATEIAADPGFATFTADEQANVQAIAAAMTELEPELRRLHDPDAIWPELEPDDKRRAIENARLPKAKGGRFTRLANLEP